MRREHSVLELQQKLLKRGFPLATVQRVCAKLQDEGKLSESRFIEAFIYSRASRGIGPLKTKAQLISRGIEVKSIDDALHDVEFNWIEVARAALMKKFQCHGLKIDSADEWVSRFVFLTRRGFPVDAILSVIGNNPQS